MVSTEHTDEATLDGLCPRNCDLTPLDYYLWGAVKYKYYAVKPETIGALKDNMREAIGEIQLHTIQPAEVAI